jgi:hypothetical protein
MKKLLTITSLACAMLFSSCLKDKGFENNEYGINLNDGSPAAVAFKKGNEAKSSFGVDVATGSQELALLVNYTGATPSNVDITVNIVIDNSILTAYNAANGTNIQALPASSISVPATLVIPAGQRFTSLKVGIVNTAALNSNIEYGVGIRIVSASNGVKVASNLQQVLLTVNIKNRYDGIYNMTGYHNRTPFTFPYDEVMHMVTTGPNTVRFFWPPVNTFGHPIGVSPTTTNWYGPTISPEVVFDLATNEVIAVRNFNPNDTRIDLFTGAGSFPSKFFPATRAMDVCWHYLQNPLRAFFDKLTYIGPRP